MSKNSMFIVALTLVFAVGCNVAVFGNLAVLALSIGIFVGTLSLGTPPAARGSRAVRTDLRPGQGAPENPPAFPDN